MKIFLSTPMSGRTDEQIRNELSGMIATFLLKNSFPKETEFIFVDNFNVGPKNMAEMERQAKDKVTPPLVYLGEAIKKMADCDAVVFAEKYYESKGCTIEEQVAILYGITMYFIDTNNEGEKVVCHLGTDGKSIIGPDGLCYGELTDDILYV